MNRPMELDIWKGDWGLASIDLDCLRLVTYFKFAGAPVQINIKNHTITTPNGKLPVFRHYNHKLDTYDTISKYLTSKNLSPDFGLSQKQKADITALTIFLKDYLYPALLFVWWVDERNRINLSRKWFARTLPFPLNFYFPDRYHVTAEAAVRSLYPNIESEQALEKEVYDRALECLTAISTRLGSQEFIFGAHPTSIDATLYAYLAPLIKVPFPNAKLKNLVLGFNSLLKYVTRISQRYFAEETQAYDALKMQENTTQTAGSVDNFPHKRRNQFLAAVFAVFAMAGYALSTGLMQIPPKWYNGFIGSPRIKRIPIRYDS